MEDTRDLKSEVRDFWDEASCGEVYASGDGSQRDYYETHRRARYELEPYIFDFAKFNEGAGKDVLEIGVGMGADHVEWAKSRPQSLTGVDLTPRAIDHTKARLAAYGFESNVRVDDAENLSFVDESFDLVYSWGVLHHSPDTPRAIEEVRRVLRPGGTARIMIYHTYSLTGYMLWARYGLLAGKPSRSLKDIYANHLESPGTKAYTIDEARKMFTHYSEVDAWSQLSFGDLLEGEVGQRHTGALLTTAKALWPRPLLRTLFKNHGLMLLIEARK
jgi:ubiquinone/menaquinone biosynthesis C-methylase UbiE